MPDGSVYIHESGFATGALWRPRDPKDFDMRMVGSIADRLLAGFPAEDQHLVPHVVTTYNQGSSPSCVAHMTAGMSSADEHIERNGQLIVFDALGLHNATGPANTGRYPGDILKYAQANGVPVVQSAKRYKIGTYAYAPTSSPEEWTAAMKAAIAAGHFCGLAMRLPSTFGPECGGTILGWETYHEVLVCGYRSTPGPLGSFLFKNSWGEQFGQNGFGWIPVSLLVQDNFQGGAVIGNTVVDAVDDDLSPPNPQPPTPTPNPIPQPPNPQPPTPDPSGFVAQVIAETNAARQQAGLTALAIHPALAKSAQEFAQWMGDHNQYGHEADGNQPITRMINAGILPTGWSNWGENIAAGQVDPGEAPLEPFGGFEVSAVQDGIFEHPGETSVPGGVFADWMNSPGHRANILFPAFTHLGVGYAAVSGSQYGTYWVMDFIALPNGPTPPTPQPPQPPTPPPPLAASVTGRATAGSSNGVWPKAGDSVPFGQDVTLVVGSIVYDGTPTPPDPGPPLPQPPTPTPTPMPQPIPGGLVLLMDHKWIGGKLWLWMKLTRSSGEAVQASIRLLINGRDISQARQSQGNGLPAVWTSLVAMAGDTITFQFTTHQSQTFSYDWKATNP